MSRFLTDPQILSLRLRHQRLQVLPGAAAAVESTVTVENTVAVASTAAIEQVLTDVCGVQAQDLHAGELSASVRSPGLTAAQVEAARTQPHSILRLWCMRGTLHLVTARDACWLNPFLGPRSNRADGRRLRQLGWDEARLSRALRLVMERVAIQGGITRPGITRPELARLLEHNLLPHEGQAPIHLLAWLVNSGRLCQGPDRGKQPCFVPFEEWAGPLQPLPDEEALRALARRYLTAYSPASPQDFAAWSGLKVGEARRAWQLLGAELVEVETEHERLWLLKTQLEDINEETHADSSSYPTLRLLPRFDTYLLGYTNRRRILAPELEHKIALGGILAATLLVAGRVAGVWSSRLRGKTLELSVQPFEPLPQDLLPRLEQEAQRVGRFLGYPARLM